MRALVSDLPLTHFYQRISKMPPANCYLNFLLVILTFAAANYAHPAAAQDDSVVRVFIFAGQSNMVGSDSKVGDIKRFPPFIGLEAPQSDVLFSYVLGRENKTASEGWVDLQAVNNVVGPELSFARSVTEAIDAPIAIIKCAAGGTHLGGDWNPDHPIGFEMYPLLMKHVKESLQELDDMGLEYRLEGFMWHQGENDMFNEEYMANYGDNLTNFIGKVRQDLESPELRFYVGELCTKTIWGMDLRPRMYAISEGQKAATGRDELAQYVPTSHVGVEIGGGVGLHYHYGTLGQLEHGVNYAHAYLRNIGEYEAAHRELPKWPYKEGSPIKLFVMAGHRNMEGERAFIQELKEISGGDELTAVNPNVAYKYSIGGGYLVSNGWEPMRPAGYYDTFGPEVSFAATMREQTDEPFAIAKFTHSGSQIIDWTPEGSVAKSRNLYPSFIEFVAESIAELESKGHEVELAGIFYHVGENDMSWGPFRRHSAERVGQLIEQSRIDLKNPELVWYMSQQPPTDDERVNEIDIVPEFEKLASEDPNLVHLKAFDLPPQDKKLVIDTAGIVELGRFMATEYLKAQQ